MPCLNGTLRPRVLIRVAIPALMGLVAAGCSNSARFDSDPFASNAQAPRPEATGSIAQRPVTRVEAQPLPAPSRPATVAAHTGYSAGTQGTYRVERADVTGSVSTHTAGHWTWDGGAPVTVTRGETVESLARKHGVPAMAIMQTNGFRAGTVLRPGQRVVIPRYVSTHVPQVAAAAPPARPAHVHTVEPGESLTAIAHKYGVTLAALAQANNIKSYARVSAGDRLTIPGNRRAVEQQVAQATVPQVTQPRTVPVVKGAAAPVESARVVTPEPRVAAESPTKAPEAVGSLPSFRWPVKGRIIAGFGPRPNGGQNDGINLAVPEGTPIKAADDGVVAYAGNELKGYGNLVLIRHPNGFVSAYANASEILVKRGDTIKRGQVIAHAGQTGNVTSPQLHFEIRKGSTPVDPIKYLGGV
jgi:murein DD-endopeptidase MepM/ murein hydrolase activator NlpD